MTRTAPPSPFFRPSTPHVVVVRQSPGGTRTTVSQKEVHEHKSTMLGCTANLVNAIVGSGIVGIPYAIQQAGFGAGLFLILLCAVITEKSLRLLISTAKHVHCPSYETAMEAPFGVAGFRFVAINMFVMAYGAMLSYLMIVKDSFSVMIGIETDDFPMKRAVLLLVSIMIMVPLSSQRDMADLAWTSRLSVIIDTVLVGLVAWNAPIKQSFQNRGGWPALLIDTFHADTIFVGLGVLSFAFVCQHSAFIIAGSLDRPTVARWSIVTRNALILCACLATTCGVSGYLGYLDKTQGNILNNLSVDSFSANAARGMLGCTMLFVYPLESFVARHVCVVLLFSGRRAHEGEDSAILNRRDRRIGLTVLLYLIAVIPAAFFEDLGSVLAATGAVGGSCLSYIGPGLVYFGVHGGRFLELVDASWLGSVWRTNNKSTADRHTGQSSRPTLAVETTPLVAGQNDPPKQEKASEPLVQESLLFSILKRIVWYILWMPFWCSIAKIGRRGLTSHIYDLALKSPHPIRIGEVEYHRVAVSRKGYIDADPEEAAVLRPSSQHAFDDAYLPMLAKEQQQRPKNSSMLNRPFVPSAGREGQGINQQIGKKLLEQQRQQETTVEPDPQEDPPTWVDFGIAIFLVLFGVLAMLAGLISLYIKG
jgi:solute carrier family 38 (sodium-coupled neutral amino acid transporter), member 11